MNNWLKSRPVWVLVPLFWACVFGGAFLGVLVMAALDGGPWPELGSSQAGTTAVGSLVVALCATWGTVRRRRRGL